MRKLFSWKRKGLAENKAGDGANAEFYDRASIDELPNIGKLDEQFLEKDVENWLLGFLRRRIAAEARVAGIQTHYVAARVGAGGRKYKWLHPDILVAEFRWSADPFREPALQALDLLGRPSVVVSCFEAKRALPMKMHGNDDIWKKFYQAVRNSLWANKSWLVFADHDPDENEQFARQMVFEMERMCMKAGVGLMRLHPEEALFRDKPPLETENTKSRIVFPAPERRSLDWDGTEILIKNNRAVADFFGRLPALIERPELVADLPADFEADLFRLSG
jgi:hypothetical protein